MRDQAYRLRQMVSKYKNNRMKIENKPNSKTRVLAITSGKGGVGKTNFTINLAISLNKLGYKTVIFDADIGLANVDIALGIMPKHTIVDVIKKEKDILEIITEGPCGLKIIAGGSALEELIDIKERELYELTSQLEKLSETADFILIDTGAGISKTVLSFIEAANEVILVTTPEPTSLTDAYALIKTLIISNYSYNKINLVVNKVDNYYEAKEVYEKLNRATKRFLNFELINLGYIQNSKLLVESVKLQKPITLLHPNSSFVKRINAIALKIVGNEDNSNDNNFKNFIERFKNYFLNYSK
ncbi:flagellar biosynthesis protein FlhG [Caloranaerobacter azorensis DSM 13643]|uniref:Flagellar biosynthesis protein FlhG n=1 Tax=Caloranaerobacter azorensis DSM 13643 TaxID=1121264 RepID=A0A1M5RL03_9FIRM|nr:MinD/ParA family protein [Caloranaerobacter azorensis]SHH26954.1 flagellar biosynthesis protein FlhG [Caloranaerobacter azorensis DSM 13643]